MKRKKPITCKKPDKTKFKGVTIKKDAKGYFVTTHRARSKSYPSINKIPKSVIKSIERTG